MVLPLSGREEDRGDRGLQRLTTIDKTPTAMREQTYDVVRFVPLLPGLA